MGGGARSGHAVKLNARGPDSHRLGEDTIGLIRRLAEHHPDGQIAAILARQGRRTGTGLPFTEARVKAARQRAGIPAAPPPNPESNLVTIQQAAGELGVSLFTIRRWLREGLLPGEQTTPNAPWRIRLDDDVRAQFVPDVPDGFVKVSDAARRSGEVEDDADAAGTVASVGEFPEGIDRVRGALEHNVVLAPR